MTLKTAIRPIVLFSLYRMGFFDLLRYIKRKRVPVVMYHRFSKEFEPFKMQIDIFEAQIRFLKSKYNFISLKHYAELLAGHREDVPNHPVILTIDDGYWDNYALAYPVLTKYNIPATIFLSTNFISKKSWLWSNKLEYILKKTSSKKFDFSLDGMIFNFDVTDFLGWHKTQLTIFNYCAQISNHQKDILLNNLMKELNVIVPEQTDGDFLPLTWDEIIEMKKNGIEFGSHTCSHPILSGLTKKEMEYEVAFSKAEIENKLQDSVISFCYPNGRTIDFNSDVISTVADSGYLAAVTTIAGLNHLRDEDPYALKRLSITNAEEKEIFFSLIHQ